MCSWRAHLSSPAAVPVCTSSQSMSQVGAVEPATLQRCFPWHFSNAQPSLKATDWSRTLTVPKLLRNWMHFSVKAANCLLRWACCSLLPCNTADRTRNWSSAPSFACATKTVSCNDILTVYDVHIAAPLFTMMTRMELASTLQASESKMWTTTDRALVPQD